MGRWMRVRVRCGAILAACAIWTATATAAATPFEGQWLTGPGSRGARAVVEIRPCRDRLCGTIIGVRDREGSDRIGVLLIRDVEVPRAGTVARGEILQPSTGQWFSVELDAADPAALTVAGCLVPGLFCRTQVWTRIAP